MILRALILASLAPLTLLGGAPTTAPEVVATTEAKTISFSLEERVRGEWRENNFDFDGSTRALTDDAWLLNRLRVGVEWRPASWLRVMVEGQDSEEWFSDRPDVPGKLGAEGDDVMDLRQAYIALGESKGFSVQIGRMELNYGDGRLISRSPWKNLSQSFDGVLLRYAGNDWSLDGFVSSVVQFRDGRFNQSQWLDRGGNVLSGLYFSSKALGFQTTEAYALELHDRGTDVVTLGARLKGEPTKLDGWDYELEFAGQTGGVGGKDLSAYAGHAGVSYGWEDMAWQPRFGIEYSYASGDSNASDNKVGTFQNLFPTNHRFYGYMDVFAWRNLSNPELRFSVKPTKKLELAADWHWFWLANTNDAWWRSNQTTQVRPISPNADSHAGNELDIVATVKVCKQLEVSAGWCHFFAGQYLKDTGASDDADFGYVMATLRL